MGQSKFDIYFVCLLQSESFLLFCWQKGNGWMDSPAEREKSRTIYLSCATLAPMLTEDGFGGGEPKSCVARPNKL